MGDCNSAKLQNKSEITVLSGAKIAELAKGLKIPVTVDEVLPDIIVVSFSFEGKLFQGVLLDSKKK